MVLNSQYKGSAPDFWVFVSGLGLGFEEIQRNNHTENISVTASQICKLAQQHSQKVSEEKMKASQLLMQLGTAPAPTVSFEVSNNIRVILQKKIASFEQVFNDETNLFYKPVIGGFWKEINTWLDTLDGDNFFEHPKLETVQLTLKPETTDSFLQVLSNSFKNFGDKNRAMVEASALQAQEELKNYLEGQGYQQLPTITNSSLFSNSSPDDIIRSCIRIDNMYEGTIPKKNIKNLIFEMRSFMMMFLLIVSTLGINKNPSEIVKNGVFIASITLLVVGVLYTIAHNSDTKEEKVAEEVKKAKERLVVEARRAVNEFVSEWKQKTLTVFRAEVSEMGVTIETLIKENVKQRIDEQANDKANITKQIAELEMKEKYYAEVGRRASSWMQAD